MVITKLLQKYRTDSGRGMSAVSEPNLQFMLNSIIDWENSIIEEKKDKDGNPIPVTMEDHFLEPGDCFCIGTDPEKPRMVIAMDSGDQIVCILNDTGVYALQRVVEEKIKPEYQLQTVRYDKVEVKEWETKNTATDLPKDLMEVPINKYKYRLWKSRFMIGRGDINFDNGFLELTVVSDDTFGMEVKLYFTKYAVYSDPGSMFSDIPGFLEDLADQVITWMYNEVPVLKPVIPDGNAELQEMLGQQP